MIDPIDRIDQIDRERRPTLGVLAGWQVYRTATNLSYLAPIFRGICKAAQDFGCNLLLGCGIGPSASPADPVRPAWPVPSPTHDYIPIGHWNTDGLIVAVPLHSAARSGYIQECIAAHHPVVFIGSGEAGPSIVVNNDGGIREALRHLIDHGHQRIAFIAGSLTDLEGDSGKRLRAYLEASEQSGLARDQRLVAYGRHVYNGGYAAMRQIMDSGVEFTAVLASNDESALGARQALQEAGRRIPQDVAIIGFDNRPECLSVTPSLTSIHVPLFQIGYRAVEALAGHFTQKSELPAIIHVDTRLVIRESCGCEGGQIPYSDAEQQSAPWVQNIATAILNQAQNLIDDDVFALCQRLVDTFAASLRTGDSMLFRAALTDMLHYTTIAEDDHHVWQAAVTLIGKAFDARMFNDSPFVEFAHNLLDEARLAISNHMYLQHRQYISAERHTSSQLSLLTAQLLTALDEPQIYEILAHYLPALDISVALVALFDPEEDDPYAWSNLRNTIDPVQPVVRIRSEEFPLAGVFSPAHPFSLTLIPLMSPMGQMGFMAFDSAHLDLYGSIVQQVGGALNTVRLYREAVEGRKLAEESNRLKSRFLSTISHELRTPLNLIIGLSGMVLRDQSEHHTLPAPVRQNMDRIHAHSQHLSGLIGDVIDLAAGDAGQLRLNNSYVDLGQALRMVSESGRQLAADKGLTWNSNLPESGPWVWGDQTRLRQILLNLVHNAIKFTTYGSVSLNVEVEYETVIIAVRDTGLGIPPHEQQAIFDEFRQTERSVAEGYGGLGLGLAITKRLVEMHGGNISVESSGEDGYGSTFVFSLPIIQPPSNDNEFLRVSPQEASGTHPKRTILIVDDEPNTLEMYAMMAQAHSAANRILKAVNGKQALEIMHYESVDLVLLDLQMPKLNGYEVLENMDKLDSTRSIPVIVMTGRQLAEADLKRLTRNVVAVLGKGIFSIEETIQHIDDALTHKYKVSLEVQSLIRSAMIYIHENYTQKITRRDIAQHVGISEDHLTFCFRQEMGTTPLTYLQRFRINQAKRLLKESTDSITEIALNVGFSDSGYFSRIFRRETGLAPEVFRRS